MKHVRPYSGPVIFLGLSTRQSSRLQILSSRQPEGDNGGPYIDTTLASSDVPDPLAALSCFDTPVYTQQITLLNVTPHRIAYTTRYRKDHTTPKCRKPLQ